MNTISIDFGTTFTSAAWFNQRTNRPIPIRFKENQKDKLPSLIYYPPKGDVLVGEAVAKILNQLNEYPQEQRDEIRATIFRSLKRRLMLNGLHALCGRAPVSHAEIVSEILRKIKQEAESTCFNHQPVEKVILSHPVMISQINKKVLAEAARMAGFNSIKMIEEPIAAALGYAFKGHKLGQGIIVYDIGGSTFDLTYVTRQDNDNFQIPLPVEGDDRCGGDDIDQALYDHWETLIKKRYARPICAQSQQLDIAFLSQCKFQKECLTYTSQKRFSVKLPPPGSLRVTRTIDRYTLNQLMRPIVDKTILKTQSLLKQIEQAGLKVDTVILTGGSSRIPLILERLKQVLPIVPIEPLQNDISVCIGALLSEHSPAEENYQTSVKDHSRQQTHQTLLKEVTRKTSPSPGDKWQEPLTGMQMIWVPAGSFQMGSPLSEKEREEDEGPLHVVTLDGFWMGKYPVTQGEWLKVMGSNPSRFKNGVNYPVEYVSWKDAQSYIKKFNQLVDGKYRFALPTEAQWEYACRAGTATPFYFGENLTTDQANYNGHFSYTDGPEGIYREKTTPVGTFAANSFGIHDMHGNVWEWCQDRYAGAFDSTDVNNPKGPSSGVSRVLRGGCWNDGAWICRSAYRNLSTPGSRHSYTGFRLTMLPIE